MTRIGGGGPGIGTNPHGNGASPHGMIGVGKIGIGRRIGKRNALIKGRRRRRNSRTHGGQVLLMQPHCPKKGTTKADQLAVGQ